MQALAKGKMPTGREPVLIDFIPPCLSFGTFFLFVLPGSYFSFFLVWSLIAHLKQGQFEITHTVKIFNSVDTQNRPIDAFKYISRIRLPIVWF